MQLRVKPSVWITTSGLSPPWTLSTARIRISSSVLWSRARASRRFMPHYTLCLLTYDLVNNPVSRDTHLHKPMQLRVRRERHVYLVHAMIAGGPAGGPGEGSCQRLAAKVDEHRSCGVANAGSEQSQGAAGAH